MEGRLDHLPMKPIERQTEKRKGPLRSPAVNGSQVEEFRLWDRTGGTDRAIEPLAHLHLPEVFHGLLDGCALIDLEGRFAQCNHAFERLLGYSAAELASMTHRDVTPPKWHALESRILDEQVLKGGHSDLYTKEYRRKDGTIVPVELRIHLLRNEQGRPAGMWAFVRNLAERRQGQRAQDVIVRFLEIANRHNDMESLLREVVAEVRRFAQSAAAGIRILDEAGGIAHQYQEGFGEAFLRTEGTLSILRDSCLCIEAFSSKAAAQGKRSLCLGRVSRSLDALPREKRTKYRGACCWEGYQSLAVVPIPLGDRIIGMLHLADPGRDRFDSQCLETLDAVALQIGVAIQRVQTKENLRRAHEELEKQVAVMTRGLAQSNEALQREISERIQAETDVERGKNLLQLVFDGIPEPLVLLGPDLSVKVLNRAALRYYGLSDPEEAIGRPCHEVFLGNSDPCEGCHVKLHENGGRFERRGIRDPNRIEQVILHPLWRKNGEQAGTILRIRDVTESKAMERQLIQNEKLASLGLLVSTIAHEINNPNSFISFNLPILRDYLLALLPLLDEYVADRAEAEFFGMPYPEFRRDLLRLVDNMEHGSSRINAIVANLRDFVRKSDRSDMRFVDLRKLIERASTICLGAPGRRSVGSFELEVPDNLPQVFTSPDDLELVLVNLLANAAAASGRHDSRVAVRVTTGDPLAIEVIDNGCGMDEETRSKIFDPFFTTKPSGEGTGLGLYVCQNLMERLGGRMEVESEPGKGTTMRILLAKAKIAPAQQPVEEPVPGF